MSERQIKEYYERIEKLLNGANKETYGFAPQEIKNILRSYEELQNNWNELKKWLKEVEEVRYYMTCHQRYEVFIDKILNKMQELEGNK